MAKVEVRWEPYDINNPDDLASLNAASGGYLFGSHAGGDDALRDSSDGTYITATAPSSYATPPFTVSTFKLRPTTAPPVGATPEYGWFEGRGASHADNERISVSFTAFASGGPVLGYQFPCTTEPGDISGSAYLFDSRGSVLDADFMRLNHLASNATGVATLYEIALIVVYDVTPDAPPRFPLRQRQRDDSLAPGGAARVRGGTSRQDSIRQRGYE